MRIREYYFEDFCKKVKEIFNIIPVYDDNTGIYYFTYLNIQVKRWNWNIEFLNVDDIISEDINKYIKLFTECNNYFFEEIPNDPKISE